MNDTTKNRHLHGLVTFMENKGWTVKEWLQNKFSAGRMSLSQAGSFFVLVFSEGSIKTSYIPSHSQQQCPSTLAIISRLNICMIMYRENITEENYMRECCHLVNDNWPCTLFSFPERRPQYSNYQPVFTWVTGLCHVELFIWCVPDTTHLTMRLMTCCAGGIVEGLSSSITPPWLSWNGPSAQ